MNPQARATPIQLVDGEARLLEGFLPARWADRYLACLRERVEWEQQVIRIRGRRVASPRLSAYYGDPGARYAYSGISLEPRPWSAPLLELKSAVEAASGESFNSALLNLYRDGNDQMGWHSDDEPELGPRPVIASLSLGAARRFRLRHRQRRDVEPVSVELRHGSLLIMAGDTQRCWKHQLPRSRRPLAARINLTFRRVRPTASAATAQPT